MITSHKLKHNVMQYSYQKIMFTFHKHKSSSIVIKGYAYLP